MGRQHVLCQDTAAAGYQAAAGRANVGSKGVVVMTNGSLFTRRAFLVLLVGIALTIGIFLGAAMENIRLRSGRWDAPRLPRTSTSPLSTALIMPMLNMNRL